MIAAPHILRKSEGPLAVPELIDRLSALDPTALSSDPGWSVARTFSHLAQGVEFSITGYPELKPALFRATVGKAAFHLFEWRGAMSHGRTDPIPGEEIEDGDPRAAQTRLITALQSFDAAETVAPHFAYGQLDKARFAAAHAMHIADHLDEWSR